MTKTRLDLDVLIERLDSATGPAPDLDEEFHLVCGIPWTGRPVTASVDDMVSIINETLPGWAWKVGTCCVSDDAWICPDHNHPIHGERLKAEFPPVSGSIWDCGVDIDLRPPGRTAIALCIAYCYVIRAIRIKMISE